MILHNDARSCQLFIISDSVYLTTAFWKRHRFYTFSVGPGVLGLRPNLNGFCQVFGTHSTILVEWEISSGYHTIHFHDLIWSL